MKISPLAIVSRLTDDQLIAQVCDFARHEREATVELVARLAELERRKLYLDHGCDSLFAYCVEVLRLSESAALKRIAAARAVLECPDVLDLLADASLNLTTVGILRPLLRSPNYAEILAAARFKSKREVELLVANLSPGPDVPSSIRKVSLRTTTIDTQGNGSLAASGSGTEFSTGTVLPLLPAAAGSAPSDHPSHPGGSAATGPSGLETRAVGPADMLSLRSTRSGAAFVPASQRPVIAPLGNERYKYQFMVPSETHERFLRAQALLRHVNPNGDPAIVFDRALRLLVKELERTRLAATDKPRRKEVQPTSLTSTDPVGAAASRPESTPSESSKAPSAASGAGEAVTERSDVTPSAASQSADRSTDGRSRRDRSRHIPADLVRQVYERDGCRCTNTSASGKRCSRTDGLQIDHIEPWGPGGETRLDNLRLLCRAHNRHAAEQYYGRANIERRIERERQKRKERRDERRSRDSASGDSTVNETQAAWHLGSTVGQTPATWYLASTASDSRAPCNSDSRAG